MGKFSDKVFGANVDQKTIDIFNALQKGKYEFKPNESVTNLPEHTKYLGEKTTFARMWVAVAVSGSDVENDIFYQHLHTDLEISKIKSIFIKEIYTLDIELSLKRRFLTALKNSRLPTKKMLRRKIDMDLSNYSVYINSFIS